MPGDIEHWDAFVSHAWEDKETFVRPLVEALGRLGVSLWYDEISHVRHPANDAIVVSDVQERSKSDDTTHKCGF